jgi:predicted nucleic acid-binding protein
MPTRPTTLSSTPVTVSRAAPWRPHRTSNDARESGTSSARLRFQPPPTHTRGGRPGTLGWASVRDCHQREREYPAKRTYSVCGVTRFVVDCETLLRIAGGEIVLAPEHKLVAPTLVRSQALSALYEAARRGEISAAEGIERVTRINSLKVRFLGDKVLQRTAWRIADQLGWETTFDAEFVALTQLQADAFITSDSELARAVSDLVETATIDALRAA